MTQNNLKICYVANSRFPSERAHMTQIVHMCNAFAQKGASVTLLVTNRKTKITEDPEIYFGVPFQFNVVQVSVPDIAGMSPHIPSILRPFLFSVQRFVFAYQTFLHVRQQRYTHLYGRDEWILWLLSLCTNIPIIWESHEARFSFPARRIIKKIQKCIVISEGIRDFYLEQGFLESKIVVAHDGVDDRFFAPHINKIEARKQLGIISEKPIVMYIGGLEDWKGAELFFKASKDQSSYVVYAIGGKNHEIEQYRTTYPHVHFLGQRPYKELPHNQQAADALIIPNIGTQKLSSHYTSPLKLFAHMTSMKPIVAARIQSIKNVVSDEEVFFFASDDQFSLHETIVHAISERDHVERIVKSAYAKSLRYTWLNRAESILNSI